MDLVKFVLNYYLLMPDRHIDPKSIPQPLLHSYLLSAVAPRPIAFASTVDLDGNVNLSPFSFFNAFGSNPPILVFSPARRGRDNTTKHTLENVLEVPEVVINICDYSMAEQMSLSSTEYPREVNEFEKAGLTMEKSEKVKPPRVGEAPVAFECKINEVISLGDAGGAGNLVVSEVVSIRIKDAVLDEHDKIDPLKLDLIGRMGANWYVRASGSSLFEIRKPLSTMGIGVDAIPPAIRNSTILTGNDLGKLGNVDQLPTEQEIIEFSKTETIQTLRNEVGEDPHRFHQALHALAHEQLKGGHVMESWKILLQSV